jgi:DNA-binding FadR family transcriptional regulator
MVESGLSNVFIPFLSSGAAEHAYEQLASAILAGKMCNGKRLPTEAQLVDQLGVSRPTVREALRMLGQAGMVERRRGRYGGWYVAQLQSDRISDSIIAMLLLEQISFSELFEARGVLEATAAALAAACRPANDLGLMRQAVEQSEASPEDAEIFASPVSSMLPPWAGCVQQAAGTGTRTTWRRDHTVSPREVGVKAGGE